MSGKRMDPNRLAVRKSLLVLVLVLLLVLVQRPEDEEKDEEERSPPLDVYYTE